MSAYSLKTRNLVSTSFSLVFFLLLLTYLTTIEIFKDTREEKSIANLLETPVRSDFIEHIIGIRFKNRMGQYTLKKEKNDWLLKEPRIMPAQRKTIKEIISALQNIKVLTIYENEPINFESFSLDKPVLEMELISKLDEKIKVKVGLINPINNTSYITVSGKKPIFQTNLFEGKLEALELSDFIDGHVFSIKSDNVKSFHLYRGKNKPAFNQISFDGNNWVTKKYNTIKNHRVEAKLNDILLIKTHMIIDELDEELQLLLKNYLENPLYKIEIKTRSGEKISYTITHLIRAISDLKIEKKQYFIVKASNRLYPYLINKKHLERFRIRYDDIK